MSVFQRIGLIVKQPASQQKETLDILINLLQERALKIVLDESAAGYAEDCNMMTVARSDLASQCDLAIVIGGDGTFLNAARSLADAHVPILGINLGRLGFLVDVSPEEIPLQLDQVLNGEYIEENRSLLKAEIQRDGRPMADYYAMNDVTLHVRDVVRMIEFETCINGQYVNIQRADGLVVCTPTGSTAYALSGGGPILHPTLDAIALVPICPHTLSNRPLVVAGDSQISIRICGHNRSSGQVSFDGQDNIDLLDEDHIIIQQHPRLLRLIHPPGYDYYHILRAKLRWSEQL
jgi:NAD+ kinase